MRHGTIRPGPMARRATCPILSIVRSVRRCRRHPDRLPSRGSSPTASGDIRERGKLTSGIQDRGRTSMRPSSPLPPEKRAGGQLPALDRHYVGPPFPREVVEGAGPAAAAADDHDTGMGLHDAISWWCRGGEHRHAPRLRLPTACPLPRPLPFVRSGAAGMAPRFIRRIHSTGYIQPWTRGGCGCRA